MVFERTRSGTGLSDRVVRMDRSEEHNDSGSQGSEGECMHDVSGGWGGGRYGLPLALMYVALRSAMSVTHAEVRPMTSCAVKAPWCKISDIEASEACMS